MRLRTLATFIIALTATGMAGAQTKVSGTLQCGKPDPQHLVEVGDVPGHLFGVGKVKCTWTKAMEIGGSQFKEGTSTSFDEITGTSSRGHGVHVSTLANGEKVFVKYDGSATLKDGALQSAQGTWRFRGGTGNLKRLRGKGTFKGAPGADGSMTYDIAGEHEPLTETPAASEKTK